MRSVLFLLLLGFSTAAFAPPVEVTLVYRPMVRSTQVVRHVLEKKADAGWPELWRLLESHGITSFAELRGKEDLLARIDTLVTHDPRSWGHVALELPPGSRPGGRVFGWEPDPAVLAQMDDGGAKLLGQWLSLDGPREGRLPAVRGRLVNNDPWMVDASFPQSAAVRERKIALSEAQLAALVRAMDALDADPTAMFELGFGGRQFSANAYNCVSAAGALLASAGVPIAEIPANGSMLAFHQDLFALTSPRCGAAVGSLHPAPQ